MAPEKTQGGYIPLGYIKDFFRYLCRHRDAIEVITYADLPWENDYQWEDNYLRERGRFLEQRDPNKIYLLLQHDVDSYPDRTLNMLKVQRDMGLKSNVMIFNRRISRETLQKTGDVEVTDYALDTEFLRSLEQEHGFNIGYHCNAYEKSAFNLDKAAQIFAEDVQSLRTNYNVCFFSHHGGARDADGRSNNLLGLPESMREEVRWVANLHTVKLEGSYSDGGLPKRTTHLDRLDLRGFVDRMLPGGRYRILLHPQYYTDHPHELPRYKGDRWYDELESYRKGETRDVWARMKPRKHPPRVVRQIRGRWRSMRSKVGRMVRGLRE